MLAVYARCCSKRFTGAVLIFSKNTVVCTIVMSSLEVKKQVIIGPEAQS